MSTMNGFGLLMKQCSRLPQNLRTFMFHHNHITALWASLTASTKQLYSKEAEAYRQSGIHEQKYLERSLPLKGGVVTMKNGQLVINIPAKTLNQYAKHIKGSAEVDEAALTDEILSRLPPITDKMIKALETEEVNVGVIEEWETLAVKATKKKGAAKVVDVVDEVEDVVVEADEEEEVAAAAEEVEAAEIEEEAAAEAEVEVEEEEEEVVVVVPKILPKNKKMAPSAAKPKAVPTHVAVDPTPTPIPSSTKKVAAVIAAPPTLKKGAAIPAAHQVPAPAAKKTTAAAAAPVPAVVASLPTMKKVPATAPPVAAASTTKTIQKMATAKKPAQL